MDPNLFTHLTFDCYGTLIDWETGILNALMPLFERHGLKVEPADILQRYVIHEARIETQNWRPYREVLTAVAAAIGNDFRLTFTSAEAGTLAGSVADWLPFADTVEALRWLRERFQLVVLSNIDDDLFAGTARRLEVAWDAVVTAEQVKSYKPGLAHFREVLRRLNVPASQVLHVAQSLYHDHQPARTLGFHTAWVQRSSRLGAAGLAPATPDCADISVKSLGELVQRLTK